MKLYTWFRSSAAFRVRIALNLKGLAYDMDPVHLPKAGHREAAYTSINPQALVPTLQDGGQSFTQSLAILEYLEETHPNPALLPRDAPSRARVRSISLLVACEIHPLNNLRSLNYLRKSLGQSEEAVNTWYRHWVADGFEKLEGELSRGATGKFCHGDAPTMADCCLVPQVFNAQRFKCETGAFPTLMRVFAECMKLDAFDRAQPSRQPEAATEP
ncbi:MAG: maleylacetoacetate isomerase [Candidatus Parcubacteria bacterium]|nr:maleylacetoacetate isomerase [Burkholderiales bacterium]